MKFKLLAGCHFGKSVKEGYESKQVEYQVGDIIETDEDLEAMFGRQKFQRIKDSADESDKVATTAPSSSADADSF